MTELIPGEALIYERANGVIYARYRDPPHNSIPRWIIGGDATSIARAENKITYSEFVDILALAKKYPTIQKQLDNLLNTYYIVRNEK